MTEQTNYKKYKDILKNKIYMCVLGIFRNGLYIKMYNYIKKKTSEYQCLDVYTHQLHFVTCVAFDGDEIRSSYNKFYKTEETSHRLEKSCLSQTWQLVPIIY